MSAGEAQSVLLAEKYQLLAEIGRGGTADVYLALNRTGGFGFQKLLVVKILRSELADEEQFVRMFLDEARLGARLNHPNIVQTNEVGEDQGRYYIAMEYLEGQTMSRILRSPAAARSFPLPLRLRALTRVLAALHYAHELLDFDGQPLRIVHRDVSPANVFVTYEGQVKLVDFGIAKAADSTSETQVGAFKGKASYMAPEQMNGSKHVDRRADIYALGMMLWEMLVDHRMWKGAPLVDVFERSMAGDLPKLRTLVPDVPRELERICERALALAPGDRYLSAAAMEVDIEAYLMAHGQTSTDRELGSAVVDLFGEERAKLRTAVDAQLKHPDGALDYVLPSLSSAAVSNTSISLLSNVTQFSKTNRPSAAQRASALLGSIRPRMKSLPPQLGKPFGIGAAAVALALAGVGGVWLWHGRASTPAGAVPAVAAVGAVGAAPAAPAVRGVTDSEVLLGMSAAFSGPARALGDGMKLGVETAFAGVNESGGIAGRKLRLVALDDGYEGPRAAENMKELLGGRGVFAVVGNVGTPTAQLAAPYAVANRTLFFGAFTGSKILRQEPSDRYVFNYRASYEEEVAAMVHYVVDAKKVSPSSVVVFAQNDGYGDAGFDGVKKALRKYGRSESDILRASYERNTVDVEAAVRTVVDYHQFRHPVKAVIMVATYKPAARFIQKLRAHSIDATVLNVSFVGSNALVDELKELAPNCLSGVIVTQVVPNYSSSGTGVLRYREALAKFHPDQHPDFVSLEGYVVGNLFAEGVRRIGRDLSTERLVDAFESVRGYDMGIGTTLAFGMSEHQASHKVWGTMIDAQGQFQSLDMD